MSYLDNLLKALLAQHQAALQWFIKHKDSILPWPDPLPDGTLLVSKAKGIYKPRWTEYALSVRGMLSTEYPDGNPNLRSDGTWHWDYHQENLEASCRDEEYTNRGLMACYRDRVAIGALVQVQSKPDVRYRILGVALVTGWKEGFFLLEGFNLEGELSGS